MDKNPDFVNKHINDLILPILVKDGFTLLKPVHFVRVRGPFIDSVVFQLSQYGSKKFFVHYYKGLISDPFLSINSYALGERLANNEYNKDQTEWCSTTDKQSRLAIKSVMNAYLRTMRPWFIKIEDVPHYIFELAAKHHNKGFANIPSAITFASGGKHSRAMKICQDLLDEPVSKNLTNNERKQINQRNEVCQLFVDVYHQKESKFKTVDDLLLHWKNVNLKKYKLSKCLID